MACDCIAQRRRKKSIWRLQSLPVETLAIKPHQENVTVTAQFVKSILTNRFLTCLIEVGRMAISVPQEQAAQKWMVKISFTDVLDFNL